MVNDKKTQHRLAGFFGKVTSTKIPSERGSIKDDIVKATHKGILPLGGLQLDCFVLEDGRRVFHKRGIARALGLRSEGGNAFMKTLGGKNLAQSLTTNSGRRLRTRLSLTHKGLIRLMGMRLIFLLTYAKRLFAPKLPEN